MLLQVNLPHTDTLSEPHAYYISLWYILAAVIIYAIKVYFEHKSKKVLSDEVTSLTAYTKMLLRKSNATLEILNKHGNNLDLAHSIEFIEAVIMSSCYKVVEHIMHVLSNNNLNNPDKAIRIKKTLRDKLYFLYEQDKNILKDIKYLGKSLSCYHNTIKVNVIINNIELVLFDTSDSRKKRIELHQLIVNEFKYLVNNAKTFYS